MAFDVLTPKHLKGKPAAADPNEKPTGFVAFSNKYIRPVLTFDAKHVQETGVRYAAAVESFATHAAESEPEKGATRLKDIVGLAVTRSKEIKQKLSEPALEMALKGTGMAIRESMVEDTLDEMRAQLPMCSTGQLRKHLEENGGDMEKAPRVATPTPHTPRTPRTARTLRTPRTPHTHAPLPCSVVVSPRLASRHVSLAPSWLCLPRSRLGNPRSRAPQAIRAARPSKKGGAMEMM